MGRRQHYVNARDVEVDSWPHLQDAIPEPLKAWAPALLLLLTAWGLCLFVAEAMLIYLFFRRRSSAPYILIVLQWAAILYFAALLFFQTWARLESPVDEAMLGGGVVRTIIYTAYLLLSKRVKATFTVRLADKQSGSETAPAPA